MTQRRPRIKDDAHLKFIRQLPCLVCRNNIQTEAAHVSYPEPRFGKRSRGLGEKVDDAWAVPLCNQHHVGQHDFGDEKRWWHLVGIDPIPIAMALYLHHGNHEVASQIVEAAID
jgi:hypothetical protein